MASTDEKLDVDDDDSAEGGDDSMPWVIERQRWPSRVLMEVEERKRWLRQGENCPPDALAVVRAKFNQEVEEARRAPIVFRYRSTDERLTIQRDGDEWAIGWRGAPHGRLDLWFGWSGIDTADGTKWIIEVPRMEANGSSYTPYPRRLHPTLSRELSRWTSFLAAFASPELAHERRKAASVGQITKALAEAVRRADTQGEEFVIALEKLAQGYLGKNYVRGQEMPDWWFDESGNPINRRAGEGIRIVKSRPTAVEDLAHHWVDHLPPDDKEGEVAEAVAAAFVRLLRHGAHYAEVAAELPRISEANVGHVRKITKAYLKACQAVRFRRRELLCVRCGRFRSADEATVIGKDGGRYSEPWPGDSDGWGCEGQNQRGQVCDSRALWGAREFAWEQALGLVRRAASTFGHPRADNLTDFGRVAEERRVGKRPG